MIHDTLNVKSNISDYLVTFVNDLTSITQLIKQPNTILCIDKNVYELYPLLRSDNTYIIDSNETVKTLDGCVELLNYLSTSHANINTKLIAIGGGIVQDLVSFCASIYCRGIEFILVPTTLLSQADSCIGGKTSINFNDRKNLIGTFYPPSSIVICTKFVYTLTDLDYISGLGEIFKFHILQQKIQEFAINSSIDNMLIDGLKFKADILSRDEFDKGERKFLNFGHTFGHALETISNHHIPHGIAVIIGSVIAVNISIELGYNVSDYDCILSNAKQLIQQSGIELKKEWFDTNTLLEITKSDKKSTGELVMVLINENGPFLEIIKNIHILNIILNNTYESIRLYN